MNVASGSAGAAVLPRVRSDERVAPRFMQALAGWWHRGTPMNGGTACPLLAAGMAFLLASTILVRGAEVSSEPRLFQSKLTIEPSSRQVAAMPRESAEWRIAPAIAAHFDATLAVEGFSSELAHALRHGLRIRPESGEGVITPDAAMLDLFQSGEREKWWAVLARHSANRSYRWPLAVRASILDELAADPEFAPAVRRIRSWGLADGDRVMFADVHALEEVLPTEEIRVRFFRRLLAVDSIFAKFVTGGLDAAAAADRFDYWEGAGWSRDVESILTAASRIEGHDRIDVAHLLPRLARALLYTFPPDFRVVGEPPVENAVVAVSFFAPEADTRAALAGGFGAWLAGNCEEVEGARAFGDIVVFENPAQARWPFAMVHVSDGVLFGRRPTMYSPWELMGEGEVAEVNQRLRGNPVRTFRRRGPDSPGTVPAENPVVDGGKPPGPAVEIKELALGPWGRLRYYDVLLSPSSELLASLPEPDGRPKWVFGGMTSARIREQIGAVAMPRQVRTRLEALFDGVEPDEDGMITVHPAVDLVFATPAEVRTRLFPFLNHGVEATAYAQSVSIATRMEPGMWFSAGVIPEPHRQAVLDLVYRRGNGLMLSDFGALYHVPDDPLERRALMKFVYRSPVLVVLLERPRPEEIPGLASYWRLDQQKSMVRLLESFASAPDVTYLDVIHLLPPGAREMMNVYMRAPSDAPTPSCYWTALNFGADRPDSRLLITPTAPGRQHELVLSKLREEYSRVDGPLQLGDVIMYRRLRDGEVRHVCTYIAADVVYTKNGFGSSSPWCLMHLADVDALYLQAETVERRAFRKLAPPASMSATPTTPPALR